MKKEEFNNSEFIDAYLEGELSTPQREQFEQQLNHDPLLRHELHRRQELLEGIQTFRQSQLKSQLGEVNISLARLKMIRALKISGSVAAISLIGALGFWTYEPQDSASETTSLNIEQPIVRPEPAKKITAKQQASEINTTAEPVVAEKIESTQPVDENTINTSTVKDISNPEEEEKTNVYNKALKAPKVVIPEVEERFEDQFNTAQTEQAELNGNLLSKKHPESKRLDINTQLSETYTFHYQFKDNKLMLLGDFSKDTYEILEIMEKDMQKVYLYYQGDFYDLQKNSEEIQPLIPIENKKLINRLYNLQTERKL